MKQDDYYECGIILSYNGYPYWDDSVVKSVWCSYRGPNFATHYLSVKTIFKLKMAVEMLTGITLNSCVILGNVLMITI